MSISSFLEKESTKKEISKIKKWGSIVYCDIDWTIYRDSFFLDILYVLIDEYSKYMDSEKIEIFAEKKHQWKKREISYKEYLMYWIFELFEPLIEKEIISYEYLLEKSKVILDAKGHYNIVFTMNYLKDMQKDWKQVVFISWSPMIIVKLFAELHGFDISFWTYLDINEKWFITKDRIILASSKAKMWLIEHINNLKEIDETIAIWDTDGDFEMLLSADMWIAVNPSNELYSKIKAQNSQKLHVIIERKDLILILGNENIQNISYNEQ